MKRIVLFALFLLVVLNVNAQGFSSWRIGLKGSPSIAWINPEISDIEYDKVSIGFSYGVIIDKLFTESYAISTGFFLTHQGGQLQFLKDDILQVDTEAVETRLYDVQYIDVPITLKMRTREIGYFTYYGQFGASLGFNIKARADDNYFNNSSAKKDVDIIDEIKLFRASLIIGAGAEYSLLGNTAIVIGLYYSNGFTNMLDLGAYESNGSRKKISARPSFLELTVGILF